MPRMLTGLAVCLALTLPISGNAWADNLTDETKKLLKEMNLTEDFMNGLDAELAVPADWIEKAKAESGPVRLMWNTDETFWGKVAPLLKARYPWLEVEHNFVTGGDVSKARLAYAQGTILMDVSNVIGREHALWAEQKGLEDISDLPANKGLLKGAVLDDNLTVAYGVNAYCLSYNTQKVKPEELPKTWDDLVNNDRFAGGKIAVNQNMTVWFPYLVKAKGKEWGEEFMKKLFALNPQRRREGFNQVAKLTSLGEFEIATSQADKQVAAAQKQGGNIAWHCPNPVPLGFTEIAIIKGNPRPYKSKVLMNWLLSREAQLAEYHGSKARSSHAAVFPKFAAFPEVTEGKDLLPKDMSIVVLTKELLDPWFKHFGAK